MTTRFLTMLVLFFSTSSFSVQYSDEDVKTVEANFPKDLASTKTADGEALSMGSGLGYHFEEVNLDNKTTSKNLVVLYQASPGSRELYCKLVLLKIDIKRMVLSYIAKLNDPDELTNCGDLSFRDLDGDGVSEIIVDTNDPNSGVPRQRPFIFKWDGKNVIDITPTQVKKVGILNAFRKVQFFNMKSGNGEIILDSPATLCLHGEVIGKSDDQSFKTYAMQDGKIVLSGSYDYLQILNNDSKKNKYEDFILSNPLFSADGTYTLEMKNLSPHKYAVRAEVIVNDSVVLKPQDFCASPPPPKSDKAKWSGNEDDDDKNEDNMKRCTPKNEVYAIVNMKKINTIKVKVYGPKSSVFQLSLVKKP